MIFGASGAIAASSKPTPKPSTKTTVKLAPKPTKKPVVKKPVVKKPVVKKPVVKKPVVKKPVVKKPVVKNRSIYRRTPVGVTPSPTSGWPPKGFRANGEIYAKVPTSTELLGVLSASATLANAFKTCSKYACGVVRVASYSGCTWWEITSTLSGPASSTDSTLITYGSIRTTAAASRAKQIITILLISNKLLKTNISVRNILITCYHSPRTETVPTNKYSPNTPSPTPSPTESASESATPMPSESATPTN
jgi:hypothetical protein